MKAIRINTIIDPTLISFEEVKEFKGKKAEIIILVEDSDIEQPEKQYKAAGLLNEYADTSKIAEEKLAYEKYIKDKYGNR